MPEAFPISVVPDALEAPSSAPALHGGEYFCTDRDLYRVEEVRGGFAMVEDCRTDLILEVAVEEILAMKPVRPASG